jgi:hypothetical protein
MSRSALSSTMTRRNRSYSFTRQEQLRPLTEFALCERFIFLKYGLKECLI